MTSLSTDLCHGDSGARHWNETKVSEHDKSVQQSLLFNVGIFLALSLVALVGYCIRQRHCKSRRRQTTKQEHRFSSTHSGRARSHGRRSQSDPMSSDFGRVRSVSTPSVDATSHANEAMTDPLLAGKGNPGKVLHFHIPDGESSPRPSMDAQDSMYHLKSLHGTQHKEGGDADEACEDDEIEKGWHEDIPIVRDYLAYLMVSCIGFAAIWSVEIIILASLADNFTAEGESEWYQRMVMILSIAFGHPTIWYFDHLRVWHLQVIALVDAFIFIIMSIALHLRAANPFRAPGPDELLRSRTVWLKALPRKDRIRWCSSPFLLDEGQMKQVEESLRDSLERHFQSKSLLVVKRLKASNLPDVVQNHRKEDNTDKPDPFVKMTFDETQICSTEYLLDKLDPVWNRRKKYEFKVGLKFDSELVLEVFDANVGTERNLFARLGSWRTLEPGHKIDHTLDFEDSQCLGRVKVRLAALKKGSGRKMLKLEDVPRDIHGNQRDALLKFDYTIKHRFDSADNQDNCIPELRGNCKDACGLFSCCSKSKDLSEEEEDEDIPATCDRPEAGRGKLQSGSRASTSVYSLDPLRCAKSQGKSVETIVVQPVVDEMFEAYKHVRRRQDRLHEYYRRAEASKDKKIRWEEYVEELGRRRKCRDWLLPKRCCALCRTRCLRRKYRQMTKRKLRANNKMNLASKVFANVMRQKKQISGSVFVTFTDPVFRDELLRETTGCSMFTRCARIHTYFTFGQPPFSSVTLECLPAPHPNDMLWENLHFSEIKRFVRLSFGSLLLVLLLVVCHLAIEQIYKKSEEVTADKGGIFEPAYGWLIEFREQIPSFSLLVVNTLIMPTIIEQVSIFERPTRKSIREQRQLVMTYWFIILNTILLPVLNLDFLDQIYNIFKQGGIANLAALEKKSLTDVTGISAFSTLMSAAFVSSGSNIAQIPQQVYHFLASRTAFTETERQEAEQAWPFAWGYWYGWSLSNFTLGLLMAPISPVCSLVCAVFFFLRYRTDYYNFEHKVYDVTGTHANQFLFRAIWYMRCIVVGKLLVFGVLSMAFGQFEYWKETICLYIPRKLGGYDKIRIFYLSLGMTGASVVVLIRATYLKTLHLYTASRRDKDDCIDITWKCIMRCLERQSGNTAEEDNLRDGSEGTRSRKSTMTWTALDNIIEEADQRLRRTTRRSSRAESMDSGHTVRMSSDYSGDQQLPRTLTF